MESAENVQLSKNVLEMKFMKKSKERVQKEREEAEGKAMYSNEITEGMRKSGNIHFIETSVANCIDLIDGRLSFGENEYYKKLGEIEKSKEKDITGVEMAEGYSTVCETIKTKFQQKKKNKKFVKPNENW